jgi:hypothetical protein
MNWGYSCKLDGLPTIGFIDTNLGIDHALACSESMETVYHIANGGAYPYLKDERSGDGFPIRKAENMIEALQCDYVVYLDCYFGADADYWRSQGKNVAGASAYWAKVENDRRFGWLEMQNVMGVGVPDGEIVKGVMNVVKYIKDRQDGKTVFYIKTSKYRGSKETGGGVTNWIEALVALSAGQFGPYSEDMEFLIQYACPGVEMGVDLMVTGKTGHVLRPYLFTVEEKGSGTIGKWVESSILDDILISKIMPKVIETDYRGYLCFEFFIDERGRLQVHDPCARPGYPCSAIQNHTITNYAEVMCAMCAGQNVKVKTDGNPYVAQVGLYTDDRDTPRTMRFTPELRPNVGFRRIVRKSGDYWYLPGDFLAATAVYSGQSPEQVIDGASEIGGKIECSNTALPGRFKEDVMAKINKFNSWDIGLRF